MGNVAFRLRDGDSEPEAIEQAPQLPECAFRGRVDAARTMEFIGHGFHALVGHPAERKIPKGKIALASMIHSEDRVRVARALSAAVSGSGGYSAAYRLIADDGRSIPVVERGTVVARPRKAPAIVEGFLYKPADKVNSASNMPADAVIDPPAGTADKAGARLTLTEALERSRSAGQSLAVVLVNIDRMKAVNDLHGAATGDALIVEALNRIQGCLRGHDSVFRTEGDEFAIVLPELASYLNGELVAQRIVQAFGRAFWIGGKSILITASLGVAAYPLHGESPADLLRSADGAMRKAKSRGGNRYLILPTAMPINPTADANISTELSHALEREELRIAYQPQFEARTGTLVGAEALLRWDSGRLGTVAPSAFIAVAEQSGAIQPIGRWILLRSCLDLVCWNRDRADPIKIAVNISPRQLLATDLMETIDDVLSLKGFQPEWLSLEVTEGTLLDRGVTTLSILRTLKELGIRLALDDFGTGYASLSYLGKYPFDALKIDRSFVRDVTVSSTAANILKAIVAMGHHLGLEIVAEGVETEGQKTFLMDVGCDLVQGYLTGTPMLKTAFEKRFLRAQQR